MYQTTFYSRSSPAVSPNTSRPYLRTTPRAAWTPIGNKVRGFLTSRRCPPQLVSHRPLTTTLTPAHCWNVLRSSPARWPRYVRPTHLDDTSHPPAPATTTSTSPLATRPPGTTSAGTTDISVTTHESTVRHVPASRETPPADFEGGKRLHRGFRPPLCNDPSAQAALSWTPVLVCSSSNVSSSRGAGNPQITEPCTRPMGPTSAHTDRCHRA
jgi:hypothetical protein